MGGIVQFALHITARREAEWSRSVQLFNTLLLIARDVRNISDTLSQNIEQSENAGVPDKDFWLKFGPFELPEQISIDHNLLIPLYQNKMYDLSENINWLRIEYQIY